MKNKKVLELRRKKSELVTRAQEIDEAAEGGIVLSEEQRAEFAKVMSEVDTLNDAIQRAERLALEGDPAQPANPAQRGMPGIHRRVPETSEGLFAHYIRSGSESVREELNAAVVEEYRAVNDTTMNVTTPADGGYLVPKSFYNNVIERLRPLALDDKLGVMDIPGEGISQLVPVDDESDDGAFVETAESDPSTRDAPAVNQKEMTLKNYTKHIDLTYQLLRGEDVKLLNYLARWVATGWAATRNKLIVAKALAGGTAALTLDAPTAIASIEVPELLYKLPARYAATSSVAWLMRRATEGYLRSKFEANTWTFGPNPAGAGQGNVDNAWLWQAGGNLPQWSDDNMGAMQASGKSLLVGSWEYMGRWIDPTISMLRDQYTRATNGEVRFHYYAMAVYEVLQAEAFAYATHPTA